MRVVHISASYKPAYIYGGPTVSVSQLCESLVAAGAAVTVFTTTANGTTELDVPTHTPVDVSGVSVVYFPRLTKDHSHFSPALLKFLWHHIKAYDVVHIHSWWNLVSLGAAAIATLKGVPTILTPRGMLSPYTLTSLVKRLFHTLIGARLLKGFTLHATARQEFEECQAAVSGWQGFILPNILPLQIMAESPLKKGFEMPLQLLFLSRVHDKKGLAFLLEALAQVAFDWRLSIAGDGHPDDVQTYKAMAERLSIAPRIKWLGWLDAVGKQACLAEHHLMVLPSKNENFANVVLEAFAAGIPVVVSDQVGLSTYVAENDLGWVCAANTEGVAAALTTAALDPATIAVKGQRALACVARDFNPQTVAAQYLVAYKALK